MILIIEGMDRCGKSTLVEQLRKRYFTRPQTIVYHASSPPKVEDPSAWEVDHYEELFDAFDLMSFNGFDVILDRFHLGAIVYGQKYRDSDPAPIYEIDSEWANHMEEDCALLLLTDTTEAIMSRDDGASMESSAQEYDGTRAAFLEAFHNSEIAYKLHINVTDNGGFENTYPKVTAWLDQIRGNHETE